MDYLPQSYLLPYMNRQMQVKPLLAAKGLNLLLPIHIGETYVHNNRQSRKRTLPLRMPKIRQLQNQIRRN